jgi:hypothetical protein
MFPQLGAVPIGATHVARGSVTFGALRGCGARRYSNVTPGSVTKDASRITDTKSVM